MSWVYLKSGETDTMRYVLIQEFGGGPGNGGTELVAK